MKFVFCCCGSKIEVNESSAQRLNTKLSHIGVSVDKLGQTLLRKLLPQKKYYLAYGSNMNTGQMKRRCPQAKELGVVMVKDWKLCFHYHANLEKCDNAVTPAVIYEITKEDEESLDRYEGYPYYYIKEYILVDLNGQQIPVMVYLMTEKKINKRADKAPSEEYLDIIRKGYQTHGLDDTALTKLSNLIY